MKNTKLLSMDEFNSKYTYNEDIKSIAFTQEGEEGMLETYNEDVELAVKIANETPKNIWTMVDADEGMVLHSGYHLVNRIYYVVTNEPAANENESYLVEAY